MSEASEKLKISREASVTLPSKEQDEYLAVRQSDFNRIIEDIQNLYVTSHWFRDLCLLCLGVCITSFFSLWLQSETLADINKIKHWAIILSSGIIAILFYYFDKTMKKVTISEKQEIISDLKELCV